ncbi:hypothetical protein BB465_03510 [Helicobacter pylori]|nr:hypothetical protein BB465_03510 [Helicobacter pylori]
MTILYDEIINSKTFKQKLMSAIFIIILLKNERLLLLVSRFLNAIDPFNLGVLLSRFQIKNGCIYLIK